MAKLILGLIAEQGGGKSTAAGILKEKFGASSHRFSDPIREFADLVGLPQERKPLQDIGQAGRRLFGETCWESIVIARCENDPAEIAIADGIREPGDVKNLLKRDRFHAIVLDVPAEERFRRIVNRAVLEGRAPPTREEFDAAEAHVNERRIRETIEFIHRERPDRLHVVDNSGPPESLPPALERLISGLLRK